MKVRLIRHGKTQGTERGAYCGAGTDEPLSPTGEALLREIPADASVSRVFTSGMLRCDQTAALLSPRAELIAVPDLREMDFGAFEGKSFSQLEHDGAYRAWVESGCEDACPGGESRARFCARCARAFARAAEDERSSGAACAVFVVHAGTIRAIASELGRPVVAYFDANTPPGGEWRGEWDGGRLCALRAVRA